MKVVRLLEYQNKETISVLRCLLTKAVAGEITGIAVCFATKNGEDAAVTGQYKAHPALAVNAAVRLSWRLTQMQDTGSA